MSVQSLNWLIKKLLIKKLLRSLEFGQKRMLLYGCIAFCFALWLSQPSIALQAAQNITFNSELIAQTPASQPSPRPATPTAQPSVLPTFNLPQRLINEPIQVGDIRLDGRKLFSIAVPRANTQSPPAETTTIDIRVRGIEETLQRLVEQLSSQQNSNAATISVESQLDPQSNLPIIQVNDQYLMTVTTLDAQLQGQNPEAYADELVKIIQTELSQAIQERQPQVLRQNAFVALTIAASVFCLSWVVSQLQRRLRRQHTQAPSELPTVTPTSTMSAEQTQLMVQQQLAQNQRKNFRDMQRRLLQLIQILLWLGGGFIMLGLFPYTRELQAQLLSTPLKVLAIAVATYLLIRVSDLIIDRFFNVLKIEHFISPESSQRIALRISTFSRVLRGLAAIVLISIAVLLILSVIGIRIIPLLAGAGIVGLGISLASQSLIKDIINGFFILLEDQYAVGDVIQVGNVSGFVEALNLRITQLRNSEGRLITIPNSAITIVENLSKDWSRVDLKIVLSAAINIDKATNLIKNVGQNLSTDPAWQSRILEPPEILGVENLDSSGITIRVWIKTQPLQQWNVGREFRRRLKFALDAEEISLGVPQQALSLYPLREEEDDPNFNPSALFNSSNSADGQNKRR